MNMGGRAYPVRHYPIAIRLRDLAFGNIVAMIVDPVNIRATCASALPTHSRGSWGPIIYSAILCIALSPQSGDTSGASLGVRSVALLHLQVIFLICHNGSLFVYGTEIVRIVLHSNTFRL